MSERLLKGYIRLNEKHRIQAGSELFRGIQFEKGEHVEADIGKNLWVYANQEDAEAYARAFEKGEGMVLVFRATRDLELLPIELHAATSDLYMRDVFKGQPQIYQRDELLPALVRVTGRAVDGFFDIGTDEMLVSNGLLSFVRMFEI